MTDLQNLSRRVEKLERQNRRLKITGGVALCMLVTGLISAQARPQKPAATSSRNVVEAEEFILKDKQGKIRGNWTVRADGATGLILNDKDGKLRGSFGVLASGTSFLALDDKDGKAGGSFRVEPDGTTELYLNDKDGKQRGIFGVAPDGTTGLHLLDKDGVLRATLGSSSLVTTRTGTKEKTAESSLVLFDRKGKVIFKAP